MKNVKRLIILAITVISLSQTSSYGQEFVKGTKMLSFGVGFGNTDFRYYPGTYSIAFPHLQANFDYGITDKVGIGYIGIGGVVGFTAGRYDNYHYYTYDRNYYYSYSEILIAGRGTYHFEFKVKKLDVYAGVIAGFRIINTVNFYDGPGIGPDIPKSIVSPAFGLFGGARYMFTEKFGVFGEIGFATSFISGGVTFRF